MSDITRRDLLRTFAAAVAAGAAVDRTVGAEVHHLASQSAGAGAYAPTALTMHEYRTVERLADLIIPVENGAAGALQAGVPPWIDMLAGANDQLKRIYANGVAWLDRAMKARGSEAFVSAPDGEQMRLVDLIAYRRNETPELAPGITFFSWVRRMTVDGFYTSQIGMRDVYLGNSPSATFVVPAESLDYALARSPLR